MAVTYPEATDWLAGLRPAGTLLGLDTMRALTGALGQPHRALRFIHVAGTNGKGSVCAMLDSMIRCSGARVGLYTSPHLLSVRERIQVNGEWISESEFAQHAGVVRAALRATPQGTCTLFEAVTAMALLQFVAHHCDWVVWETGLGGRLDATNIVTPRASVITSIALDHQDWLGSTLGEIAREKAGIIKPGVPVLAQAGSVEVRRAIEEVARAQAAPLTWVLEEASCALLGEHQRRNAGLAAAVARQVGLEERAVQAGLAAVKWPGRAQLMTQPDGRRILLDGAHNPAGAAALAALLRTEFAGERISLLLACSSDKDWAGLCGHLAPLAARLILVPNCTTKAVPTALLAQRAREANPRADILECEDVAQGLRAAANDAFLVATGSLYLVGAVMEALGCGPQLGRGERDLNEWAKTY